MLLDVLTLLGALYVLLTIVEYLCSLLKPAAKSEKTDRDPKPTGGSDNSQKDICNTCGQRPQQAKSKIQYIIMANELGTAVQHQQPEPELDQYQSEILKRRKRIAAGEVKGFYLTGSNTGSTETGDSKDAEGPATIDRRHSSYSGDYQPESDPVRRRSVTKDVKSCDADPSVQSKASHPNMVGLSKDPEHGYYIDPNNWISGTEPKSSQAQRQQQFQQRSSYEDRRSSLDTVPVKLSAPVTVIKSSSGSGSPFKISENSAFTPIQPRRDASVERRPPLLSATSGSLHAQSFPDVSGDSGVNTAASTAPSSAMSAGPATAQGPIQITVVMRPTSGSGSGQQSASQKVSSTLVWTSTGSTSGNSQQKRSSENLSTDSRPRPVLDVSDTESKAKDTQPSPVRLKMVQTVTSAFQEPHSESKIVQPAPADPKIQNALEPESPIKLKIIQPSGVECDETQQKPYSGTTRKPYVKSSTTALASTAALAKATAAANYRNNYYSNSLTSKDFETVAPHRRQHTPPPPPPPPSSELLTPQLLKKQSPLHDTYPRHGHRPYYPDQPQMALTRAMRTTGPLPQQGPKMFYGGNMMNETTVPQPYHPPTMASYEHQQPLPPSPRAPGTDASRFPFGGAASGPAPSFEAAGRQPRQQQRTRYSPMAGQNQYQDDTPNVVWRPTEARGGTAGGGGGHQHSLSVDEGMGYERSRSRERSRIHRQQQPGYSVDENVQPPQQVNLSKASAFDPYRSSFDEDKTVTREITDQGVPTTEDVLKGGNVSSKTKLFEALAEQELQEVDAQHQHFYSQPPPQRRPAPAPERWVPPANTGSGNQLAPKHKKMERSHTVHTVRSLMAPDAYQYENAPYNQKNPYLSFQEPEHRFSESFDHHQQTPSPRHSYHGPAPVPAFYAAQKQQENQVPPPVIHIPPPKQEAVQFPPASISPRSVHREHAIIEKGHPFQQAQVVQPHQPHWQSHAPPSPQVQVQVQQIPAPVPIPVPAQHTIQAPVPVHAVTAPGQRQVSVVVESDGFEDEMSKMSIADKAKLFEQKAEEQSRTKRRYNVARHKTTPVTTLELDRTSMTWPPSDKDEVLKARSVINEQLAKPGDGSRMLKPQRSGATDEEAEEHEEDSDRAGSRASAVSTGRNVIIYQRPLDRRSTSRVVDDAASDKEQRDRDQRQQTPSSTSGSGSVKPRRIVYLHSNENGSNQNLESHSADLPPPTPTKKQMEHPPAIHEPTPSDQNNNDKANRDTVIIKSGDSSGVTASLVNGSNKKPSPPARGRQSESDSASTITDSDHSTKDKQSKATKPQEASGQTNSGALYTRSIGVREKAKRLMADIAAKQNSTTTLTNGHNSTTNGHNGHLPSRILVNHDDDDHGPVANGSTNRHDSTKGPDSDLDRFCSRAQDLERIGNEAAKVEDESFMSIVTAPVIRLQHFERPKPNRRHSTCGSRRSVPQSREPMRDKNGAIIVNQ